MARRKKNEEFKAPAEYSKREVLLSNLRNNKIPHEYITELVMDYKARKKIDSHYQMPRELAEVLLIIIDKNLGSPGWRGYTADWKEEFRGRAIEHVVKYGHNFNPIKCEQGKRNDAYNYFSMIINRAFIQSWKKLKAYSEANVQINHDIVGEEDNQDIENMTEILDDDKIVNPDISSIEYGLNSDII